MNIIAFGIKQNKSALKTPVNNKLIRDELCHKRTASRPKSALVLFNFLQSKINTDCHCHGITVVLPANSYEKM